jgi:hypothetical protein
MNILELVIGQLVNEKNLLEFELEQVINDKNITVVDKVDKSKKLLKSISEIMTTINITTGYLPVNKNEEVNNT